MKELKKKDFKVAKIISEIVERLDKIVFPKNTIEVFILQFSPPDEAERFRYCSQTPSFITDITDSEGEIYLIFGGGLTKRIKR